MLCTCRSQKAAAIAASCNIHPLNQEVFQVRMQHKHAKLMHHIPSNHCCTACTLMQRAGVLIDASLMLMCMQVQAAPGPEEVNWQALW